MACYGLWVSRGHCHGYWHHGGSGGGSGECWTAGHNQKQMKTGWREETEMP